MTHEDFWHTELYNGFLEMIYEYEDSIITGDAHTDAVSKGQTDKDLHMRATCQFYMPREKPTRTHSKHLHLCIA